MKHGRIELSKFQKEGSCTAISKCRKCCKEKKMACESALEIGEMIFFFQDHECTGCAGFVRKEVV